MMGRQGCCYYSTPYQLAETRLHGPGRVFKAIQAPARVLRILNQLNAFYTTTLKELEVFVLCTFDEEDESKKESALGFRNTLYNAAVDHIHKPNRDREIARYTSKDCHLMFYMQKGDNRIKCARKPAALDVQVKTISTMLVLKSAENEERYLPVTGHRYLYSCQHISGIGYTQIIHLLCVRGVRFSKS